MRLKSLLLLGFALLLLSNANAQLTNTQIKEYLKTSSFPIDADASAVVLYERISIDIANEDGRYVETRNIHKTIKILKRDALSAANVKVYFPKDDYKNYVYKLKGATYNLDGDSMKETPLPKGDYYKDKLVNEYYEVSFTLPEAREGSIIDYSYDLVSPAYGTLPVWDIQDEYPKLVSEYSLLYPSVISFTSIAYSQKVMKVFPSKEEAMSAKDEFCKYVQNSYAAGKNYTFWVRKNITPIKAEPFVINMLNHKERMELQVLLYNYVTKIPYNNTWEKYNQGEWDDDYAKNARKTYEFLKEPIHKIVKDDTNKLSKAKAIFSYVRANFKTGESPNPGDYNVKTIFDNKRGSWWQVNTVLIAMLNNAGLEAYPMTISTTDGISAASNFPVRHRLVHMVCALVIDDYYIYLDAGNKNNVFGIMPLYCYNGYARVISQKGEAVMLSPDLLEDISSEQIKITCPGDTVQLVEITHRYGMITSSIMRKELEKEKNEETNFIDKLVREKSEDATMVTHKLENTDLPDTNLVVKLTYKTKINGDISSYFMNTSCDKIFPKNPFLAAKRVLPVEFQYRSTIKRYLNVTLPSGCTPVDSLPNPVIITFGDNNMEYRKSVAWFPEMSTVSVNVTYKNNQVVYENDKYDYIRDFYAEVIRDENKIIAFKRK